MSDAYMRITGVHDCPLYRVGDEIYRSGKGLLSPQHKPICLILASDIMEMIMRYGEVERGRKYAFDCSGCTGSVHLEYRQMRPAAKGKKRIGQDATAIVAMLSQFPLFESLDEESIIELVSFLKLKRFERGEAIIKKGESGENLFIIVSGRVEVVGEGDMTMAYLGKGEIFGEMSLLSGDAVGATIRVVEPARVLYLNGDDFRRVLASLPSLQMYLACLLARRLAQTNMMVFEEFSSGMIGKLSEMPPSGLFQMFNLNQKTGVLQLELDGGNGVVVFRDGEVIRAAYNQKKDREAFFALIQEREGRFKFMPGLPLSEDMDAPILGDFIKLLMEGVRRIDESACR